MREQDIQLQSQIELPNGQRRVDELLGQEPVVHELKETRYKATQCRTSSRDEFIKRPPRFCFVSEYHAAIYDPKRGAVHEGQWSDLHYWIARDAGVAEPENSWNGIQRYISCDVFALRAVRQVRVAIVDTLYGFEEKDLTTFEGQGYVVMSPNYDWLIRGQSQGGGISKVPSKLGYR